MFWYILQIATMIWTVNFFSSLHTQASAFAIYLLSFFITYLFTAVLSLLLWGFPRRPLPRNTLLGHDCSNHPRVHIAHHTLAPRRTEHR